MDDPVWSVCRIPKLPSGYRGRSSEMIINSEWGDFKGPCLPSLPEDLWVDCSSVNPGGRGARLGWHS